MGFNVKSMSRRPSAPKPRRVGLQVDLDPYRTQVLSGKLNARKPSRVSLRPRLQGKTYHGPVHNDSGTLSVPSGFSTRFFLLLRLESELARPWRLQVPWRQLGVTILLLQAFSSGH